MISAYEKSREERIKENLARMQKLGLKDLSFKLKSFTPPVKRNPRGVSLSAKHASPVPSTGSLRRSSRLQNGTPITYSETVRAKKGRSVEDEDIRLEVGSKPEVYTEEHEKLLGNTERSWTFFVDGYGKDGRRIYDQINGKTCHQCRQKTLGYRTECSNCKIVQGQFCGDCLYMRYGEHVLEALENPSWICPGCRGICNCSLCRQAKGWPATGALYRKISRMGYKSVAHYLIQTRRSPDVVETDSAIANQASTKDSVPFSDIEAAAKQSLQASVKQAEPSSPLSELEINHVSNDVKEKERLSTGEPGSYGRAKRSLHFSGSETLPDNMTSVEFEPNIHEDLIPLKLKVEDQEVDEFKGQVEKKLHSENEDNNDKNISSESCSELKKRSAFLNITSPDRIAARLRQRRRIGNGSDDAELTEVTKKTSVVEQTFMSSNQEVDKEKELGMEDDKQVDRTMAFENTKKVNKKPSPTRIGGRLLQCHTVGTDQTDGQKSDDGQALENTYGGKESGGSMKASPGQDCIARRLRPRHKTT